MTDKPYTEFIQDLMKKTGLVFDHLAHVGRVIGPLNVEIFQVTNEEIKLLGYWFKEVYNDIYSRQIPLVPMKVMASYKPDLGKHFNFRKTVPIPVKAQHRLQSYLHEMNIKAKQYSHKQYYSNTVKCLFGLREIMSQDLAYYACNNHAIYNKIKHLPAINNSDFIEYKTIFVNQLREHNLNKDKDSLLKESIPEVYEKLETNQ